MWLFGGVCEERGGNGREGAGAEGLEVWTGLMEEPLQQPPPHWQPSTMLKRSPERPFSSN